MKKPFGKIRRKRRQGVRPTVGLIVEGDCEFVCLPLLHRRGLVKGCPPIKATNLGGVGSDIAPAAIAKMVVPKIIAHKAANRAKVIVCIDRESRKECPGVLAEAIFQAVWSEMKGKNREASDVHIVIADRAFESWLLAGATGLYSGGQFKTAPTFHCFEGELGERQEKGCRELSNLLGHPYSKMKDGPALFGGLDFPEARLHGPAKRGSKSLDKLLRTLGL